MEEFRFIYDKYSDELITLIDNFGNETQDLEKKNQHANSIIDCEEKWIADLKEIKVPDFLKKYHDFFLDYLGSEILFYRYFVEADLDEANISEEKADDSYEKSLIELESVKENFNSRAENLNLDPPF